MVLRKPECATAIAIVGDNDTMEASDVLYRHFRYIAGHS